MSDSDVYTAEKILAKRNNRGVTQYLIKWMNFPRRDSTWEPVENVLDPSLLDTFYEERRGSKRKSKKSKKSKPESPTPSRDRSPTRSPASRRARNSVTPELGQLVLDESQGSDQTIADKSSTTEDNDRIQTPDNTVSEVKQELEQPIQDARSQTPQRPALRHSPAPKTPVTTHQSPPTQKSPAARQSSPTIRQLSPNGRETLETKQTPAPKVPVVRQSPAPKQTVTRQSPTPTNISAHLSTDQKNKTQSPIKTLNLQSPNNRHAPDYLQLQAMLPKNRKSAVMNTVITDVTVNDHTITISESKTGHGFFKEVGKNSVDATTQF